MGHESWIMADFEEDKLKRSKLRKSETLIHFSLFMLNIEYI